MPRTIAEIMARADELADLTESEDDPVGVQRDGAPVRALRAAFAKRAEVEVEMVAAVESARAEGYSWALIGSLIGTSGQAARERYGIPRPPVVARPKSSVATDGPAEPLRIAL